MKYPGLLNDDYPIKTGKKMVTAYLRLKKNPSHHDVVCSQVGRSVYLSVSQAFSLSIYYSLNNILYQAKVYKSVTTCMIYVC